MGSINLRTSTNIKLLQPDLAQRLEDSATFLREKSHFNATIVFFCYSKFIRSLFDFLGVANVNAFWQ